MKFIQFIDKTADGGVALLGGKGAGLAFMTTNGFRIPRAFVVTANAYREAAGPALRKDIISELGKISRNAPESELEEKTSIIRDMIVDGTSGHKFEDDIAAALETMSRDCAEDELCLAVRSSSIDEDSADQSFAGEHDTYLWVSGADDVNLRIRQCWASLVTSRAVAYRPAHDTSLEDLAMAVVVQQMAPARSAGVMMTLNPQNGDRSKIMIESVWGLGEPLVSGEANPDRFLADKVTGEIIERDIATKPSEAVRASGGKGVVVAEVEQARTAKTSLTDAEIRELVRVARDLERVTGSPQDIEFAVVGDDAPENVQLLQCRPETVWSNKPKVSNLQGKTAMESLLATLTAGASSVAEPAELADDRRTK